MRKVILLVILVISIVLVSRIASTQEKDQSPDLISIELFDFALPDEYEELGFYNFGNQYYVLTVLVDDDLPGPGGGRMQISKAEVFIFEMDEDECILLLHDTLTESLTVSFEDTTSYCVKIESAEFAEWQGDVFVVLDGPIQFVGYNMFAPDLFVYRFEDDNATKVEWLGYTCPGGRPYDWEITDYGLIMWMMDPDLPWYTEEFRILQIVYSYAPSYGSIVPETTAYTDELYTYETFPSEPLEVREYEG